MREAFKEWEESQRPFWLERPEGPDEEAREYYVPAPPLPDFPGLVE